MILVDTVIWADHIGRADERLTDLLLRTAVLGHPFILGELALGNLARRDETLGFLSRLPQIGMARVGEVMALIEERHLHGTGIGFVDASLLASVLMRPGTKLWTRDRRLNAAAAKLDVAMEWTMSH